MAEDEEKPKPAAGGGVAFSLFKEGRPIRAARYAKEMAEAVIAVWDQAPPNGGDDE